MSMTWAEATRIVNERRAARQAQVTEAEAVVRGVIPIVTAFGNALREHTDSDMLRWIATGKLKTSPGEKAMMHFINEYEPERGRIFRFDLDSESWSVDSILEVERGRITIGRGGGVLLASRDFEEVIAAVQRLPTWLPVLLVQKLQDRKIPVPTD